MEIVRVKQKFISEDDETDEKIVLDRSTFKALASNTRVSMLKELDDRRKTLSELSTSLDLSVATIKEHLSRLVDANLIKQKDDGRKWKYYDLTEKGRCILYPERKKLWVLLVSLLAVVSMSVFFSGGSFLGVNLLDSGNPALYATMQTSNAVDVNDGDSLPQETMAKSAMMRTLDEELESNELQTEAAIAVSQVDEAVEDANNHEEDELLGQVESTDADQAVLTNDIGHEENGIAYDLPTTTKNKLSFIEVVLFIMSFSLVVMIVINVIKLHYRRMSMKRK